jgi:hypothetical protein
MFINNVDEIIFIYWFSLIYKLIAYFLICIQASTKSCLEIFLYLTLAKGSLKSIKSSSNPVTKTECSI